MFGIGPSEMMILMTLFSGSGLGVGLPLGMPPMPEDPAMANVAPAECLWYWSWAGMAEPDPKSANQTEQMLAEQEIQGLVDRIETVLRATLQQGARGNPQGAVLAEEVPKVVKTILTRPAAVFISSAGVTQGRVAVEGGLMVNLGERTSEIAAFKQSLLNLEQVAARGAEIKTSEAGGATWRQAPLPPDAPPVAWTIKGRYLIVGLGAKSGEKIIARASGSPPAWLTDLRDRLPVERRSMVSYLNIKGVLKNLAAIPQSVEVLKVIQAMGVDHVSAIVNVTGLDGQGVVSRSLTMVDDPKAAGLISLMSGAKPLTAKDLKPIPKDATFGVAARFDLGVWVNEVLALLEKTDPAAHADIKQGIAQMEGPLGISLSDDLFKSLGDVWCVYNSPGDGGLLFTGVTAVVQVRDRKGLSKINDVIVREALRETQQLQSMGARGGMTVRDFEFKGQRVFFLNFIGESIPFAPAWCLTDDELIVSLYPQMIKSYLSRDPQAGSLADLPAVAQAFNGKQQPIAISYQDTPAVFRTLYPFAHMLAAMACSQLQREGIQIDISVLPSARAILPHLSASTSAAFAPADGIESESRHALPAGGGISGVAPIAVALLVPAVQAAREAAMRTQSTNNMKQIGLAMFNDADTFGKFPAAALKDKAGKPLLSWRVQILPFIEQQQLFQQFKMDEPWDSEHNKKLIPMMPQAYAAPGSKVAAEGKTNYLTVRGDDTVFPAGGDGTRISAITDGTSNTIMAVEVSDDKAVIWTKPDDFEFDARKPAEGLIGLRRNGFIALFADGSVQFLPAGIKPESLAAMFTRAGGEVIDRSDLGQSSPGGFGGNAEFEKAEATTEVNEARTVRENVPAEPPQALPPPQPEAVELPQ